MKAYNHGQTTTPPATLSSDTAKDLCRLSELAAKAARKILECAIPEVQLSTLGDVLSTAYALEWPWDNLNAAVNQE